jgi:hypothetical protein
MMTLVASIESSPPEISETALRCPGCGFDGAITLCHIWKKWAQIIAVVAAQVIKGVYNPRLIYYSLWTLL